MNTVKFLLLVLAFAAGWVVKGWQVGAADTKQLEAQNRAMVRAVERGIESDAEAQTQLEKANAETNRLRACIRNGTCGLRVNVLPSACPGAAVDSGTGARLTPDAEQAYYSLRDGLAKLQGKLQACQQRLAPSK
jgi:hypothetical protein